MLPTIYTATRDGGLANIVSKSTRVEKKQEIFIQASAPKENGNLTDGCYL
jgi:hypothetical protein